MSECSEVVAIDVPSSALKEQFLRSYFEHTRYSGGSHGDVKQVQIKSPNAFVTVRDGQVAKRLVSRSPFDIHDNEVEVKLVTEWQKAQGAICTSSEPEGASEPEILDTDESDEDDSFEDAHETVHRTEALPKSVNTSPKSDNLDNSPGACTILSDDEDGDKAAYMYKSVATYPARDSKSSVDREIPNKPKVKPKPSPKPKTIKYDTWVDEEPLGKVEVKLRHGQAQYIEFKKLLDTKSILKDKCKANFVPKQDSIEIEGPEKLLVDVKLQIFELAQGIEHMDVPLKPFACGFIKKQEVTKRIYETASTNNMSDLFLHVDQNTCYLLTQDTSGTTDMVQFVQKSITEESIDLTGGYESYTSTGEWSICKSSATSNKMVTIEEKKNVIVIQGLADDVRDVKTALHNELSKNANTTKKLVLSKGQCGLLHKNYDKIDGLKKDAVGKTRRPLDHKIEESETEYCITFEGHPEDVNKCIDTFQNFLKTVADINFTETNKQGLDYYMTRNDIAKNAITALESKHKCCIDVMVKKPDGELVSSWKKPTEDKRKSGGGFYSRFGRNKDRPSIKPKPQLANYITFTPGSIEKFTKAEAVVNTVPNKAKTMDECGALGRAFCAYVGPDLEGEMAKILPVNCGEVRETDISAKGLKYKFIIHAGIRTWSERHSPKALAETVTKCYDFATKTGLGSIAFPSIGCGQLKFPPKVVYDAVNAEASKRKNIKTYMVVFDKKILSQLEGCVSTGGDRHHSGNRPRGTFAARGTFAGHSTSTAESTLPLAPTVKVQKTDITQFTGAHVLVNTLANKSQDIKQCGVLAKVFAEKGGPKLLNDVQSKMPVPCGEVVPSAGGSLMCKLVLHAAIRKWEGHKTKQVLEKIVEKCFKATTDNGFTSIAFPTIGCGNLKFPPDEVYTAIANAANKPGRSGIQVFILPFDNDMSNKFQGFLIAAAAPPPPPSGGATGMFVPDSDEDIQPPEEDNDEDIPPPASPEVESSPFSYNIGKAPPDSDPISTPKAAEVTFNVCALTEKEAYKVKDAIRDHIKERFLREIIKNEAIMFLKMVELQRNIYCHGSQQVAIRADQSNGTIELTGERDIATNAKHKIELYLKEMEKLLHDDPQYVKLNDSVAYEDLKLRTPSKIPRHWTSKKGGKPISEVKQKAELVKVDKTTRAYIEKMIDDLWKIRPIATGVGADAKGLSHNNIKIKQIQRVENPPLWADYDERRKKFRLRKKKTKFPILAGLQGEADVITYSSTYPEMQKWVDPSINERLMFHGTKNIEAVWKQGLDFRMTGDRALFGKGLYLAETPAKADQYTDPRDQRKTKDLSMLLVRSLIGNMYVAKDKTPHFNRPPCASCSKYGCNDHNEFYDSVLGTHKDAATRLQYREYIIYDQHHAYPEFVITYDRV